MKRVKYWKSILMLLSITSLSVGRSDEAARWLLFEHQDKLVHLLMYLALSYAIAWDGWRHLPQRSQWLYAAGAAFVWGVLMELVQWQLPYRSAEWLDLLANALGAVAGAALFRQLHQRVFGRWPWAKLSS